MPTIRPLNKHNNSVGFWFSWTLSILSDKLDLESDYYGRFSKKSSWEVSIVCLCLLRHLLDLPDLHVQIFEFCGHSWKSTHTDWH